MIYDVSTHYLQPALSNKQVYLSSVYTLTIMHQLLLAEVANKYLLGWCGGGLVFNAVHHWLSSLERKKAIA
jgi:hypothetical protein